MPPPQMPADGAAPRVESADGRHKLYREATAKFLSGAWAMLHRCAFRIAAA